jgi:hypothetical protein
MAIPPDSQAHAACCHGVVITLSTVVMHFDAIFAETSLVTAVRIARIMLNDVPISTIFINSKPRFGLAGGSQGPLSGADAPCPVRRRGKTTRIVVGESPRRKS